MNELEKREELSLFGRRGRKIAGETPEQLPIERVEEIVVLLRAEAEARKKK